MTKYDFQTINDKEFEELSKELLNKKFNLSLQSFRKGRDKGIDLRLSTPASSNAIVVQAKHYYASGYQLLIKALKEELPKVKALNPERYMIVTSVPISPSNQDEIKSLFQPYIRSASDIIGNETLNDWLGEFPDIERKNFKLWMSSINIIENILRRSIYGRSEYYSEEIRSKLSLFVPTRNLTNALKILRENRVLIVSGEPGIGKSTLCDMICLTFLQDGYNLFKIENISEVEDVLSSSISEKQLFFFDDFLGSIYLELALSGANSDTKLNSLLGRIRKSPNKALILASRTVILNQAMSFYEKFKTQYREKENIELSLADYSNLQKGRILYNHLYYRNLRRSLLDILYEGELYLKIIKHKNYNPRIVDFISDPDKVEGFEPQHYKTFILSTIQNPSTIWETSFQRQINSEQRFLLLSLFTFKENIAEDAVLQQAYNARLDFEIQHNGHIRSSNSYINSIKILLKGFILRRIQHLGSGELKTTISYVNPSLGDYIQSYLLSSQEERVRILLSIVFIEQLQKIAATIKDLHLGVDEYLVVASVAPKLDSQIITTTPTDKLIIKLRCLLDLCPSEYEGKEIIELFEEVDLSKSISGRSFGDLYYILGTSKKIEQLYARIEENFSYIVIEYINNITDIDAHADVVSLFSYYGKDLKVFMRTKENGCIVHSRFQQLFDDFQDEQETQLKKEILEEDQYFELKKELTQIVDQLNLTFFDVTDELIYFDFNVDWEQYIEENRDNYSGSDNDYGDYDERHYEEKEEDRALRDLFDR